MVRGLAKAVYNVFFLVFRDRVRSSFCVCLVFLLSSCLVSGKIWWKFVDTCFYQWHLTS